MLTKLHIVNYKCLDEAIIDFAPLTIITGTNSSGKSSVLQTILLSAYFLAPLESVDIRERLSELSKVMKRYSISNFKEVVNQYSSNKEINLNLTFDNIHQIDIKILNDYKTGAISKDTLPKISYEENLYYLSAHRTGQDELSLINSSLKIGHNGDCAIGTFESFKDNAIDANLIFNEEIGSTTLKHNLAFWLSRITGCNISFQTERISGNYVKSLFIVEDLGEKSPNLVGAGNGYLTTLLIMCLIAKPGDILLIENPEIHLHPGAQSKTGEFLAFISSRGVQLVVETHSEHLINRIRYEVYSPESSIKNENVIIHYKPSAREKFIPIHVNARGHFTDLENNRINFPSGYFDATLDKLMEIG